MKSLRKVLLVATTILTAILLDASSVSAGGSGTGTPVKTTQFNWAVLLIAVLFAVMVWLAFRMAKCADSVLGLAIILLAISVAVFTNVYGLSLHRDTFDGRVSKAMNYCRPYHYPTDPAKLTMYGACIEGFLHQGQEAHTVGLG